MPVVTITVNQWRIKSNAETGANDPVVCVNHYEWVCVNHYEWVGVREGIIKDDSPILRGWGPKIGETEHYHDFVLPAGAENVRTIYDPVNKTPCQASCWMQFNY